MRRILGHLQAELSTLHAVRSEQRVEDYVVSARRLSSLGLRAPQAEEELLVVDHGEELSLAVYYGPRVLAALRGSARDVGELLAKGLHTFGLALEGVSHFLYLTHRAAIPRPVSLLELEVQAEVDKFAVAGLHLRRAGRGDAIGELLRRLFTDVSYLPHLGPEALERYRTANRLALGFSRALARLLEAGLTDRVVAELRHVYRLGAGEKLGYLARAG